jgi:stress responsive alpha/beta barrel protein
VIRHIALLTFTPDATDAQIDAFAQALSGLPERLPNLRSFAFGRDAGINPGQASFAVVADFDTVDDYIEYRDDPGHRRIIAELLIPILAARAAAQYEI